MREDWGEGEETLAVTFPYFVTAKGESLEATSMGQAKTCSARLQPHASGGPHDHRRSQYNPVWNSANVAASSQIPRLRFGTGSAIPQGKILNEGQK